MLNKLKKRRVHFRAVGNTREQHNSFLFSIWDRRKWQTSEYRLSSWASETELIPVTIAPCQPCSMQFKWIVCHSDGFHSFIPAHIYTANSIVCLTFTFKLVKLDTENIEPQKQRIKCFKYRNVTDFYLLQSLLGTLKMVHHSAYTKRTSRASAIYIECSHRLYYYLLNYDCLWRRGAHTHVKHEW